MIKILKTGIGRRVEKLIKNNRQFAFSMVEVIISASIILVFITAVASVHSLYLKTALSNKSYVKAPFLAEEAIEIIKFMRDSDWNNLIKPLAVDIPYYIIPKGNSWVATTSISTIDNTFDRQIVFSNVYRDAFDNISTSGAFDPNTKKVDVSISWLGRNATTTYSISTYLTNLFEN